MSNDADERTHHSEDDGRCVEIDTGFYRVQVWGDTSDSFDEVAEKAKEMADRAKADAVEMDDRIDGDEVSFR